MDAQRFLECLDDDYLRLREVAVGALERAVPTCPGWRGDDLVRHVAEVYLHKAETMRLGSWPSPWPPDMVGEPLELLADAYHRLVGEFRARTADDHALTWYGPEQTVGFWIRRMAQETVVHRLDAEAAAGVDHRPVPVDLAEDGIDEVLVRFLAYGAGEYPEEVAEQLAGCDGRTVRVVTDGAAWQVRLGPVGIAVERGGFDAEATVAGSADAVLRWVWRRAGDDVVRLGGDREVTERLRELLGVTTQ